MQLVVIDPLPMFRQGMLTVLSELGHQLEAPARFSLWSPSGDEGILLLTLQGTAEWDLLARVRERNPQWRIIGVLTEQSAQTGVRAVRAGARSVLYRSMTATVLRHVVESTIDGNAVIPAEVAQLLSENASLAEDDIGLRAARPWLRQIAAGMTVAQLAQENGYSERAMYRLLHDLYRKLGARTKIEAVLRAKERGIL